MPKPKQSKGSKSRKPKRFDASLNHWESPEDIPLDEEDAFHASRDKVLLDVDSYGHHDDDGDDDEVFALKGLGGEESDDESEGLEKDEEDYENESSGNTSSAYKVSKSKKKEKKRKQKDSEEEDSEEETWGRGKAAYYSSNAAQLESDDEEGHELEEQEAIRLQRKALEGMDDEDFGLNDKHEISHFDDAINETDEAPLIPPLPKDRQSLLRHLEKTNPEALALARDWDDTVWALVNTRKKIAQLQSAQVDPLGAGMAHLHYRAAELCVKSFLCTNSSSEALLTYATTLAFYLHLRTSQKYAKRPELLTSHPIMQRLLTLKQSVSNLEDLGFVFSESEPEFDEDDDESLDLTDEEEDTGGILPWPEKKRLEPGELDGLLEDAQMSVSFALPKPPAVRPLTVEPPKKKRKLSSETIKTAITPVFDLQEPEFAQPSKSNTSLRTNGDVGDAYGEAMHLQAVDAADKGARKKSLRFHTSKIESTSAKRRGARNQTVGGDDDIPYRERQKEKETRLAQEAKKRMKNQGGEDLDNSEPQERTSEKRRREGDSSDDDEGQSDADGYYELVKRKNKEKKEQKKVEYETNKASHYVTEEEGTSGPRSLTRAILTNKGLTPHRPKAVRNPRVKKRQKYEKAKKKLSSQRPVYKGGLSETGGRYDGEKSGISKVIKSVKLG